MKKLNLLYALIFAAVAVVSCSKDDESPTFKKEDFYATWEENDSEEDDGCTTVIKIDATKFYTGSKCPGSTDFDFDAGYAYTFDSKQTFTIPETIVGSMKYVITAKTATTFTADAYLENIKFGSIVYTKL